MHPCWGTEAGCPVTQVDHNLLKSCQVRVGRPDCALCTCFSAISLRVSPSWCVFLVRVRQCTEKAEMRSRIESFATGPEYRLTVQSPLQGKPGIRRHLQTLRGPPFCEGDALQPRSCCCSQTTEPPICVKASQRGVIDSQSSRFKKHETFTTRIHRIRLSNPSTQT